MGHSVWVKALSKDGCCFLGKAMKDKVEVSDRYGIAWRKLMMF
jgi:hypothetical protein